MKPYDHLPLTHLEHRFTAWKGIMDRRETCQIFFLPHEDIAYRIHQFADWLKKHQRQFLLIDLVSDMIDDELALKQVVTKSNYPVIIIARQFFHIHPDAYRFYITLEALRLERAIGILMVHEGLPSQLRSIRVPTSFHQHSHIFPLYTEEAITDYADTLLTDWGSRPLTGAVKREIFATCGGNIWLVTDILRSLRTNPDLTVTACLEADSFQHKAAMFWESLPHPHRTYMAFGSVRDGDSREIERELREFRLTGETPPPRYLADLITRERGEAFAITESRVRFRGEDLTNVFSRAERRILELLYTHQDSSVSRDRVGQAFWNEGWEEKYSDWALDKVVSRLRKKVQSIGIPLTIITARGKGYGLRTGS